MSALGSPRLVFGDDGSPGAVVAWLWINEHRRLGWRLGTTARQLVHNRDVSVLLTHRRIEQHVDARAAVMGARRH